MQTNVTDKLRYLYGEDVDTSWWATMYYRDVLELKIKLACNLIGKLNTEHCSTRDFNRVNDCAASMSFNDKLLQELP